MDNQLKINQLQHWYLESKRDLPFRKTKDPYAIWVSEIMLQQTKIDTVLPYYNRFMMAYPTVFDLAKTTQEALLALLEGIGYYRRFTNLLKASHVIVETFKGIFPNTYKDVKSLPGIGAYTAGAIMSIAYNQPYAATDGNVIRVLSRVYKINEDMRLEKNKKKIHEINQQLIQQSTPYIYTQAIMELGALICLPRNPKCLECPIKEGCLSYHNECQMQYPVISKLAKKKVKHYSCLLILQQQKVIIRKRTEKLLEGMFEFPQYENHSFEETKKELSDQGVIISLISKGKQYTHIFTHQKWVIDVFYVTLEKGSLKDWIFIDKEDIYHYPMSKAHRQIAMYEKS